MSLPSYLKVLSSRLSDKGWTLELSVRRWHPSWWLACWREARAYVRACVELELFGRQIPPLWHPVVLWHTVRATLAAIIGSSAERISPEGG
jgi:hypothetical protein